MKVFLTVPFFRILIPFVAGIVSAIHFPATTFSWMFLAVLLIIIAGLLFYKPSTKFSKFALLVLADIFLFMYGLTMVFQSSENKQDLFYGRFVSKGAEHTFIAVIDELPLEKERTFKLSLQVLEIKTGRIFKKVSGNIFAYVRKSGKTKQLKAGDVLMLRSKLQEIPAPKNPLEFNYKTYLANRQIYHSAFVDSTSFAVLPVNGYLNPVWATGLFCKDHILKQLKSGGLTGNSYAICAALLTGYDDEIEKAVMEAFSHSGTLHVLSVSGLHTGLIYLVLGFLFDLADRKKKYKLLKFVFITVILWLFALITGFSSPVLRAVLMFNLLGLGKIYFRHDVRNQMNILLVSAFILLVYNPFFITDVGFQLSYFALAGLIFFQPPISSAWRPRAYLLNLTWQSVSASVSATISTLPLTLLYFKQFPLWFFVCNLVVVPVTFVLLLLAVLVVFHVHVAAVIINYTVNFLVVFINLFNANGYGFVDMIHFTVPDALLLSALIVMLCLTLQYRSYLLAKAGILMLICWQLFSLGEAIVKKQSRLFTLYDIKKGQAYSLKNKTRVFVRNIHQSDYNFHVKPQLISFSNPEIVHRDFNYLRHGNNAILILDKPFFWPSADLKNVKILVLCNNFMIGSHDLVNFDSLELIVSGSSNNSLANKKNAELCRKFGLDFYDVGRNGAYAFGFN